MNQPAAVALIAVGAFGAWQIYEDAPPLEPEDARNYGKWMLGVGTLLAALGAYQASELGRRYPLDF